MDEAPTIGQWWELCTCGHSWMFHDIDAYDDPRPSCCAGGCPCGPGSYVDSATSAGES